MGFLAILMIVAMLITAFTVEKKLVHRADGCVHYTVTSWNGRLKHVDVETCEQKRLPHPHGLDDPAE